MDTSGGPAGPDLIRVVIVDDEALVRTGLAAILGGEADIDVVGQGEDGADVPGLVRDTRPDVVLMDVRMPRIDGVTATQRLAQTPGAPAVVVITTFESDDHVRDALLAGARGFVLKRARAADLVAAVRAVARTESALVFPDAIRRVAVAGRPRATTPAPWVARLTPRERDILAEVVRGATNAEVAAELFVSVETVKTHLKALLAKSGSRHRTELVVRAYEAGLLTPPTSTIG